ncbi:MAG: heavy metal translocating P-type ATPase, partial [bacterium]
MESKNPNIYKLHVDGFDCPSCFDKMGTAVEGLEGVQCVKLNLIDKSIEVQAEDGVSESVIAGEIRKHGLQINGKKEAVENDVATGKFFDVLKRNSHLILTAISGVFIAFAFLLGYAVEGQQGAIITCYALGMAAGGFFTVRKALLSLRRLSPDMNLLMMIAVAGAIAIGELHEGAMVLFLFAVAELLENRSMDRARNAIGALLQEAPTQALVRCGDEEKLVDVETVRPGEIIVIRPGEKVPLDGEVVSGRTSINQAPITGESMPVEKSAGDEVFAGTMNQHGAIEVRSTRVAEDTTLARIIKLIAEAQSQKAPIERAIDRFARYYTPAVIAAAVLVMAVPPLLFGQPFADWFYRALVLLVISCPCALVISTPVSIVSALSAAAANGVLIKGGIHLENVGALRAIAFDKTGTLTRGAPRVTEIIPLDGRDENELLQLAAAVETRSEHPIGRAIIDEAIRRNIELPRPDGFDSMPGKGARGIMGKLDVYVGNHRLCEELEGCTVELHDRLRDLEGLGRTAVIVGDIKTAYGLIIIEDEVRENSLQALNEIREAGIEKRVMLTGDNGATARKIADKTGISEVKSDLLPEDKVAAVRELLDKYGRVGMVGDGVNDAPALAAATVGIAMGTAGTDAALETADIALMADDLGKLPFAIRLSRRTMSIIRQNIAFAIAIKMAFFA